METCPGEGDVEEESFQIAGNPLTGGFMGEYWNLRGQYNWEEKQNKTHTHTRRISA